jgi:S-adenosylmethionine synthetase
VADAAAMVKAEGAIEDVEVAVNAGDDDRAGRVFLTVTGTSAEAGDDGQVGRGNRVNGLITPYRPMTLEAAAGKNPVSHVGKLYNVAAHAIAADLVRGLPEVAAAQVFLVSRIGWPIDDPPIADVRLATRDGAPVAALSGRVEPIVREGVAGIGALWRSIVNGEVRLF